VRVETHLPAYEDGTECSETSAQNSDAGESPKRKHTTADSIVACIFMRSLVVDTVRLMIRSRWWTIICSEHVEDSLLEI